MNSLERILAAVAGKKVDRTPVMPVLLQQGARALGISLRDYFGDPRRLADGQRALVLKYGHDAVYAFPHVVQDTMPWGAGLTFHDEGPPSVNRMAIDRYEEIPGLVVPDPTRHPYLRRTLEAAADLRRTAGGDHLVVGAVIGPFSLPTLLMGTGKFFDLLFRWPEHRERFLQPLLDKMVEYTTRWAQAQLDAGCHVVVVAEGIASATILTAETFQREALPVLRRFLGGVKGLKALELVGDTLPFAGFLGDLDVAAVLVGGTDPVDAVRTRLGGGKAIIGNLNNLKLLRWTPERVRFEARRVIRGAGPGFILANQGPEIPWAVPDENIAALVAAVGVTAEPARV